MLRLPVLILQNLSVLIDKELKILLLSLKKAGTEVSTPFVPTFLIYNYYF
jgi:hypothetical protein